MSGQAPTIFWRRAIELSLLLMLAGLTYVLYALGYLDRILGSPLTFWFLAIIGAITLAIELLAFAGWRVDVHFWSWLVTGLGMLGTVLGFSLALAGIEVEALQDPAALSAEIGDFLAHVAFAIDTTLIGLSAAMVMEAMHKARDILYTPRKARWRARDDTAEG